MDPLEAIDLKKDSTLAIMRSLQRSNWQVWVCTRENLQVEGDTATAFARPLAEQVDYSAIPSVGDVQKLRLARQEGLHCVLLRTDPPFNMDYIFATYVLDAAERKGVLAVNAPEGLRRLNEKMALLYAADHAPPTLVSAQLAAITEFISEHQAVVIKPLDGMGGKGILRLTAGDGNIGSAVDLLSGGGERMIMVQKFVDAVTEGDTRVFVIEGQVMPWAVARIPLAGEVRANMAAGGKPVVRETSPAERAIGEAVAPILRESDILFAGLDVIGGYLTEINVTSPTCLRQVEDDAGYCIADDLVRAIENRL